MVTDEDGNRKFVKIVDSPNSEQIVATPSPVPDAKPKKGGSLCIIFRKVFILPVRTEFVIVIYNLIFSFII